MSSSQVQRRHKLSSLGLSRLLAIAREVDAAVTGTMAGSDIVEAILASEEQYVICLTSCALADIVFIVCLCFLCFVCFVGALAHGRIRDTIFVDVDHAVDDRDCAILL